MKATTETDGGGSRLLRIGAPLIVLILIGLFVGLEIEAPFGYGVVSDTAVYCELFARSWDDLGFVRSLGIPMVMALGPDVRDGHPYLHHPVVGWWPPYLGRAILGRTPAGYRLFPVLFTALAAWILFRFVRRRAGPAWGVALALLFFTAPLVVYYGSMPNMETFTLPVAALQIWLWWRWRDDPKDRRRFAWFLAWFLVGSQVEWSFYLLAPGIWVAELLRPGGRSLLWPTLWLLPVGIGGFALALLHMALGTGSLAFVVDQVAATAGAAATAGMQGKTVEAELGTGFFDSQAHFLWENLGYVGAAMLVLALASALGSRRWRRDPLTAAGVALVVQGVLAVVLFNSASATHGYYWFPVAPGAALLFVQGARALQAALGRQSPRLATILAALLMIAIAGAGHLESASNKSTLTSRELEAQAHFLDGRLEAYGVDPAAWISSPETLERIGLANYMLYSHHRWTPPLSEGDWLDMVLEARERGHVGFPGLAVVLLASARERFPRLVDRLDQLVREGRADRVNLETQLVHLYRIP